MNDILNVQLALVSSMTRGLSWVYSTLLPLEMGQYECYSFNPAEASLSSSSFIVSPEFLPLGNNSLKLLCVSTSISREQKIPSFKVSSLLSGLAEVISFSPQKNESW